MPSQPIAENIRLGDLDQTAFVPIGKFVKAIRESSVLARLTFDVGNDLVSREQNNMWKFVKQVVRLLDLTSEFLTERAIAKHGVNSHVSTLKKASRLQTIVVQGHDGYEAYLNIKSKHYLVLDSHRSIL